MQNYKCQ